MPESQIINDIIILNEYIFYNWLLYIIKYYLVPDYYLFICYYFFEILAVSRNAVGRGKEKQTKWIKYN